MTRPQFELLMFYIDAQVDAQLAQRGGYDADTEVQKAAKLREELELSGIIEEAFT